MHTLRSKDGTTIAFDRYGDGPPLLYVGGAMNDRSAGATLAALLAPRFTVVSYDRRGRGDSGDPLGPGVPARSEEEAVAREVEDLAAVVEEAGGTPAVFGMSSGAGLVLEAAARGLPIGRLAVFEPPFLVEPARRRDARTYAERLADLLGDGRHADAVELFMTLVGVPAQMIAQARQGPFWPAMEAMAPSLAYDSAVMRNLGTGAAMPADRLRAIPVPALVLDGGASPAPLREAARQAADTLPAGRYQTLAGQTHAVAPEILAPALEDFLAA